MGIFNYRYTGILIVVIALSCCVSRTSVHAPELIRGNAVTINAVIFRASFIDGGNWQALQIGRVKGNIESGYFIRLFGENIDNNNQPVPYSVERKKNGKYLGSIYFRGHERKLCAAPIGKSLPCR